MPGPVHLVRLLALAVFLVLVALGLWLLDIRPALVIAGMALALAIAWTIEWLAWSGLQAGTRFDSFAPGSPPAEPPARTDEPLPPAAPEQPVPAGPAPQVTFAPQLGEEAVPPSASPAVGSTAETATSEEARPAARRRRFFGRRPIASGEPAGDEAAATERHDEPAAPPAPAAPAPPRREPKRPPEPDRRELIRSVPAPPPAPPPAPSLPSSAPSPVVPFPARAQTGPRQWNLWDLERLARKEARSDPSRRDEWSYLILHLRRFASADGLLPTEFDPLVRESFGGLLERSQRT